VSAEDGAAGREDRFGFGVGSTIAGAASGVAPSPLPVAAVFVPEEFNPFRGLRDDVVIIASICQ
jgi:hypothetical protein